MLHLPELRLGVLFLLALLVVCFPRPAVAEDGAYLVQLWERAQRERLAERPEWRALLHYQPQLLSRKIESEVDEPGFFLAPNGKTESRDELHATLGAFFQSNPGEPDKSPQCLFPARYHWLKQVLEFEADRLPALPCPSFDDWFQRMNPGRMVLVFPAAYLNNPASMFGHTLLRLDPPGENTQTQLLANTINYAADTHQEQRGVQYAFRGLFGGYRGRFSIAPYYAAVKTYGDIENRDIWEYGLDLKSEQLAQLLRHLWEMRSAWFDYYFLDENCSYQLLSLLETARSDLRLTGRFRGWAIPSETVRAVAEAGLLQEVRYRPARNTVLQERLRFMDGELQELARGLALGESAVGSDAFGRLAPEDQAKVIELALDYLAYRQSLRFAAAEPKAGRVGELLLARSRLEVPDQTPTIAAPRVPPGQGHKPARARVAYGVEDRRQFIELAASPAFHDLLDPDGGYTRGAQVKLLSGALRYYPEAGAAELEALTIIDIMSLSSWNRFLHPVSWNVAFGVARKRPSASDSLLLGSFNAGVGMSHDFSAQTSAYGFAEGTLELSGRFDYLVAPGVGPRIGLVHDFSESWRTAMSLSWSAFFLDEWRNDYRAVLENRVTITRQNIAGLDLEWKREFGHSFPCLKVYWQHYF
jgi:hypothetical protein